MVLRFLVEESSKPDQPRAFPSYNWNVSAGFIYPKDHFYFYCVWQIGQIQLGSSMEINITVQIDPEGALSAGQHFLSVPSFTIYEQRMASNATKMFVGSIEVITVNFTVREGN